MLRNESDVEAAHVHLLRAVVVRVAWIRHNRTPAATATYLTAAVTLDLLRLGIGRRRQQGRSCRTAAAVYLTTAPKWVLGGQQCGGGQIVLGLNLFQIRARIVRVKAQLGIPDQPLPVLRLDIVRGPSHE